MRERSASRSFQASILVSSRDEGALEHAINVVLWGNGFVAPVRSPALWGRVCAVSGDHPWGNRHGIRALSAVEEWRKGERKMAPRRAK